MVGFFFTILTSLLNDLLHLLLLFILFPLGLSPNVPPLDVGVAACQLHIVNRRGDLSQLLEDWHHDELDEACLAAGYSCGIAVAEHGDL